MGNVCVAISLSSRSILVDDAVAPRGLAADHGQQAPGDIVILPELVERFLPPVGEPPSAGLLDVREKAAQSGQTRGATRGQ